MNRRKFIKQALAGLPFLLLPPSLLAQSPAPSNGKIVGIVGAGIAGLAAAGQLQRAGFEVVIWEAQNKVGGRLRTDRSLGLPFDEGASWIHGARRNPLRPLAEQAGIQTVITDDEDLEVFDTDGSRYTDSELRRAERQFRKALRQVRQQGRADKSFQLVFEELYPEQAKDKLWKYMLSAYLEFSLGGDISQLSSQYFHNDDSYRGDEAFITNGYDKLAEYLAQGLAIRLGQPVLRIDYAESKVKLYAKKEVLEADYVLVTVPLGVLKRKSIRFSPSLPASKRTAIDQTGMGTVNKFLLLWDKPFWDTALQYIGYTPDQRGKFNYFLNMRKFSAHNALMTFAFGEAALETEGQSDEALIATIQRHLKAIYGKDIPAPRHFLRSRWGQDPYTFGAYAYAAKGHSEALFDQLAQPVDGKLFFAGEHTEKWYRGTVHGAYSSGLREADRIGRLRR